MEKRGQTEIQSYLELFPVYIAVAVPKPQTVRQTINLRRQKALGVKNTKKDEIFRYLKLQ